MMTRKSLRISLAGLLFLSACAGSGSRIKQAKSTEGEVVEAEGTVPYREGDLPGTKAAALAAAQRSAVELVVGVYVNAKTRVDKAVAIENSILAQTGGYVKRYEILSEGRSGEWYKMRIRALVSTQALHDKLDSLGLLRQPAVGHPRVTIMLQEYIAEKESSDRHATRALTQSLLNQGFKVVELPKSVNRDDDPVEAARLMSKNNAEILVAGLARAQSLGYGEKQLGGMSSFRASVSLRVIETGTGEVIQTSAQTASGLEGTADIAGGKALEKAAELAAMDLKTLPEELAKRAHVDLTITGLTSFEALAKFQKALVSERGVKDHYLRSFSQEKGLAVLDVLIDQIGPQELADRCAQIGGTAWTVYQVTGRSIQLSASPAGR